MDSVGNIGSRKRVTGNHYSAEEQALDQIAKEAESRLIARRLARAEAREIRMKELEKQQKEMEENADRQFASDDVNPKPPLTRTVSNSMPLTGNNRPILPSAGSFQSSRRGSEDSTEDMPGSSTTLRDLRQELKELEEKFRKAMVQNAQSDNEKASLMYQVELFKDKIEDMDEAYSLLQKEARDKHRECEESKREMLKMQQELTYNRYLLEERDKMIQEHGLVIVGDGDDEDLEDKKNSSLKPLSKVLVSADVALLLEKAGEGSLDVRIRRLTEEKNELSDQLRRIKLDLEEERTKSMYRERISTSTPSTPNCPVLDLTEWQKEAVAKQVNDYKIKLQKSDQEIATLQATVARLETQVTRYRASTETLEKSEDELKAEKRKLQRELREIKQLFDETDAARRTLQRQYDKLKHAR